MLIILTICHLVSGACREVPMSVPDAPANPAYCLAQGQPMMAEFMAALPNYRIARARCMSEETYKRLEKKA